MGDNKDLTVQKIMKCLAEFKRVHKHKSPICNLTHSETMVLFSIKGYVETHEEGVKTSELSNILNVASPTITQQINSLEARGFVERSIDKQDRRAVRIKVTEKGEEILKKASKEFEESINGLVEYLGEEKSDQLADLLSETFNYFINKRK
ncbi:MULTISPECIES: MarR family transcriptional regulator [Clostridium]|jgi:DNA-binding MarR family transcriptional regulator|uniref:MarR family winged helix-turn-helix transcriptional regulator n=1 Tax=Clostridium TaxID=1485 RepID=UPI0002884F32|nr:MULTISPECIES: MarR family transcriptional regulator [Clostridium]MDF2504485.1 transcriptional regulator [Clostridium sp.]